MGIGKAVKLSASFMIALTLGSSAYAESKRYLVKFKSPKTFQALSQKMSTEQVLTSSDSAQFGKMSLLGTEAAVSETLDNVELVVVESKDAKSIESLRSHPAIAYVEEEVMHPAPQPVATWDIQSQGARTLGKKKRSAVPTPWGIEAVKAPGAWNTTRGENTRVLVLDTGVDTGHPALASRIESVRNFTGGSPDDVTDTVGHGSHCAGTILADGLNGGLVGVAPAAKLLMGKVCSDRGCSSVAIAQGLNWAVSEKVQVVSMSLGGMFITPAETQALDAAEARGVTVVAASGNDGTSRVSYPAAYRSVFAVGAIDNTLKKADFSQWGPELAIVAPGVEVYSSVPRGTGRESSAEMDLGDGKGSTDLTTAAMQGSPLGSLSDMETVDAGLGKTSDFANIDVRGKMALISRGEITFKEKVTNAIAAGAAGAIIYNNAPGLLNGALTDDGTEVAIPAVMIEQQTGLEAKNALSQGSSVRMSLSVARSDFALLQGTSMATPHVAGVVALIRAANPSLTPAQVRDIMKNTATALGPNDENQYGSGLVNAEAAVAQALNIPVSLKIAN